MDIIVDIVIHNVWHIRDGKPYDPETETMPSYPPPMWMAIQRDRQLTVTLGPGAAVRHWAGPAPKTSPWIWSDGPTPKSLPGDESDNKTPKSARAKRGPEEWWRRWFRSKR
ncbi:MAG: hypothetical protein ACP5LD_10535 [Desulfomonilaceae bacterium]